MINAIICEFNPFHNGHKYLITEAKKKTGAEATVCIMSGNFVQRGEPSMWNKHTRAAAAIRGGADLVLQIPTVHSLAGANVFGTAGVYIANALGVETSLCFGSESEDINDLFRLAMVDKNKLSENFKALISEGMSYAAAAQGAYEKLGVDAGILKKPNNLLAFEYIKAANALKSEMKIVNIQRAGADHDGDETVGEFASATYIRSHLTEEVSPFLPEFIQPQLIRHKFDQLLLFFIYACTAEKLVTFADMTEGIENRFQAAAAKATTFEELCEGVKSKRYTASRIRRTAMNAFIQNPKGLYKQMPPMIRVLAFNDKGRSLLRTLQKTASLPIVIKPTDAEKINPEFFALECRATDIFDFCSLDPKGRGSEYKTSPIYIKGEN